jgi:ribosomal protein L16 Arg81 hydroxylase
VARYVAGLRRNPLHGVALEQAARIKRMEWQALVQRTMRSLTPAWGRVDRLPRVSRQVFLERYYSTHTPVVLTRTMTRWPALKRWTPRYLKEHYGHVEVEVAAGRSSDPEYQQYIQQHSRPIQLRDYIDWVEAVRESDEMYMVAHNNSLGRPELQGLLKDIRMNTELLDPRRVDSCVYLWYGPGGTLTPLHHDTNNILFHQVVGRKQFKIVSPLHTALLRDTLLYFSRANLDAPDYERFPYLQELQVLDVELGPGEALFLPAGWWHHVRSLDISISLSMTNFVFPNSFGPGY